MDTFSPALHRSVGVVTIVNVAVRTLSVDLHAGLGTVQWVVTAYLLALAAVIPVTGWAARRFGAARLYVVALAVFTVGSVLCVCSPSAGILIASRALQGVGGGAIMPWSTRCPRKQPASGISPGRAGSMVVSKQRTGPLDRFKP